MQSSLNLKISNVVGDRGLEPPTSRSQTARASQLRQSPSYVTDCLYFKVLSECLRAVPAVTFRDPRTSSLQTSLQEKIRFRTATGSSHTSQLRQSPLLFSLQ